MKNKSITIKRSSTEKKIFNNSNFNGMPLGRAQLKHILGGVMPSVDCKPSDKYPVKNCAKMRMAAITVKRNVSLPVQISVTTQIHSAYQIGLVVLRMTN